MRAGRMRLSEAPKWNVAASRVIPSKELRDLFLEADVFHEDYCRVVSSDEYRKLLESKASLSTLDIDHMKQQPCTPGSALNRIEAAKRYGLCAESRVLLVGDDDLLSVALSKVRSVQVVDAAANVLSAVRQLAPRARVSRLDIASGRQMKAVFTHAFCDPPYDLTGARAFIKFAHSALCPGGRLILSYSDYGCAGLVEGLVREHVFDLEAHEPLSNIYVDPVSYRVETNRSDLFILRKAGAYWRGTRGYRRQQGRGGARVWHEAETLRVLLDDGSRGIYKYSVVTV